MKLHALFAVLAVLSLNTVAAEYSPGDFIPTARKGQFHGVSARSRHKGRLKAVSPKRILVGCILGFLESHPF
eukprot:7783195-Pyramimonas_sp.AAC.1